MAVPLGRLLQVPPRLILPDSQSACAAHTEGGREDEMRDPTQIVFHNYADLYTPTSVRTINALLMTQ